MSKVITAIAAATVLAIVPAAAKDKSAKSGGDKVWNENKELLQQEGQNREPGPDGTFQGKPVVQGPADWHSKMGGASSGASSGEAGDSGSSK